MPMSDETSILQQQILGSDDPHVIGQLVRKYEQRLERIVAFRMDPRLKARIDPADVLQEALVEAVQRIEDFRACADRISFFLWLRFIALQKLAQLRRHHLGVQARDAAREVRLDQPVNRQMTSVVLAAQLLGNVTSPSHAAMREENRRRLMKALGEMDEIDREVLALRHFEHLGNGEVAALLELSEAAASNRYFRAVRRLKSIMNANVDGSQGIFQDD